MDLVRMYIGVTLNGDTEPEGGMEWTKETTTRTVRVMYRCAKCKAAARVEFRTERTRTYRSDRIGAVHDIRRWFQLDGTPIHGDGAPVRQCCGRPMRSDAIRGTYNKDITCSAKCVAAVGHQCECSCGGKNHGGKHAA